MNLVLVRVNVALCDSVVGAADADVKIVQQDSFQLGVFIDKIESTMRNRRLAGGISS